MSHELQLYIDGVWVEPATPKFLDVIDPSNEDAFAKIAMGSKADVDKAVAAAKRAFSTFGFTSREERLELLRRIVAVYKKRSADLALAVSREMGAPRGFSLASQVGVGLSHLEKMVETLENFEFERLERGSLVVKEPIGVVGLITPWNWPLNQITCKVAPALAAGCAMILKPSEIAPLDAIIFAEISTRPAFPAACSISSTATDPPSARRSPATPTSTWSRSPVRPARESSSPRRRPTRSSASTRSWAANPPTSCSRTSTSQSL